jgi:hypothetical protein
MSFASILKRELESGGQRLLGSEIECVLPVTEKVANTAAPSKIQVTISPDNYFELSSEQKLSAEGWLPEAIDLDTQRITIQLKRLRYFTHQNSFTSEEPALSTDQVKVTFALRQLAALKPFQRYLDFLDFLRLRTEKSKLWVNLKLSLKDPSLAKAPEPSANFRRSRNTIAAS